MAWITPESGYRPRRGEPLVPYAPDENEPAASDDVRLPEPSLPRLVAAVEEPSRPGTPASVPATPAGASEDVAEERHPASDVDLVLEGVTPRRSPSRPRPATTRAAGAPVRESAAPSGPRNLLPWLAGALAVLFALAMWRGAGRTDIADEGPYPPGVQGVWERVTPDFEGQYLVLTTDSVVVPATLQRNTGTFPVLEVTSTEAGREISVIVRFRGPSGEETLEFLVDTPPVTVLRFRQPEGMLWKRVKSVPPSP